MTNIITIDGKIGDDSQGFGVTLNDVKNQVINEAEEIEVHINSFGGDVNEGFAIHDYLKSLGKPITTVVIGKCYSIATIIMLAGSRRLMYPHSEIGIHNPIGKVEGNADRLEKYASWVRSKENQIADFYANVTNTNKSELQQLMNQETLMGYDQAKKLGFITGQVEEMKAAALMGFENNKSKEEMEKLSEEQKNWFEKMFAKIENAISSNKEEPKPEEPAREKEEEPSEIDQLKAKIEEIEKVHAEEVETLMQQIKQKDSEKETAQAEHEKQFAEVQASLNELKTQVFGQEPPKQTKQVEYNQPANQFSKMFEALKDR